MEEEIVVNGCLVLRVPLLTTACLKLLFFAVNIDPVSGASPFGWIGYCVCFSTDNDVKCERQGNKPHSIVLFMLFFFVVFFLSVEMK